MSAGQQEIARLDMRRITVGNISKQIPHQEVPGLFPVKLGDTCSDRESGYGRASALTVASLGDLKDADPAGTISSALKVIEKYCSVWLARHEEKVELRLEKCNREIQNLCKMQDELRERRSRLMERMRLARAVGPWRALPEHTIMKLNVGGREFSFSLRALRLTRHSRLDIVFSGRHRCPPFKKLETYFFDQNGDMFATVVAPNVGSNQSVGIPETKDEWLKVAHQTIYDYFLSPLHAGKFHEVLGLDLNIIEGLRKQLRVEERLVRSKMLGETCSKELQTLLMQERDSFQLEDMTNSITNFVKTSASSDEKYAALSEDLVNSAEKKLMLAKECVDQAEAEWDIERKVVDEYITALQTACEIDVNGTRLLTCVRTLTKVPNSLLQKLFSPSSSVSLECRKRVYRKPLYIMPDSDSKTFIRILDYLRSYYPHPPPMPPTATQREKLWAKTRKYGIQTKEWLSQTAPTSWFPGLTASEHWKLHYCDKTFSYEVASDEESCEEEPEQDRAMRVK